VDVTIGSALDLRGKGARYEVCMEVITLCYVSPMRKQFEESGGVGRILVSLARTKRRQMSGLTPQRTARIWYV
jgi:hypothetical protein